MKKQDIYFVLIAVAALLPFFVLPGLMVFYSRLNATHPFWMSFLKFAILATTGEMIGLRIRTGSYHQKGFGVFPRAIVWGFLGVAIKIAFVIFGEGAPRMLAAMGVDYGMIPPAEILNRNFFSSFSGLQLLTAFAVSVTMNTFFAPVFMTFHKITDTHILNNGGSWCCLFRPVPFGRIIQELNWDVQWNFVFKKTIPLFWYPAHTITFLLPAEFRILFAAILGVVLGVLLSVASLRSRASGV